MNTVEPIKDIDLLDSILQELEEETDEHWKRIYLLFITGIYTGLRISDIVGLRVGQVNTGDKLRLEEIKTGKKTNIKINPILRAVYDERLDGKRDNEFLFPSRQHDKRGRVKHITTTTAENDLKKIKERYDINFPFSCHSLRKTFGYWHYKQYGDIESLRKQFNHSTETVTRRYIGIDEEEQNRKIEKLRIGSFKPQKTKPAKKRSGQVNDRVYIKRLDRSKQGAMLAEKAKERAEKRKRERG